MSLCLSVSLYVCTRWFKYDRDKLWLVYTQIVPVIFEPPCMHVCLHGTTRFPLDGFGKIWYFILYRKTVEEIQVWLKSNKNNGHFTWRLFTFMAASCWVVLRVWNVSSETLGKITCQVHFMSNNFFSEIRAFFKIMSKNVVETEMLQITIWRRFACWIIKATCAQTHAPTPVHPPHPPTHARTHTHRPICNTYCFSTAKMVSWTRHNITSNLNCLSCLSRYPNSRNIPHYRWIINQSTSILVKDKWIKEFIKCDTWSHWCLPKLCTK
jgi:hypothetical protein